MIGRRAVVSLLIASVAAGTASGVAGCGSPATPDDTKVALWTLGGLRNAYLAAPNTALGVGLSPLFNKGFTPSYFLASENEIRIAPAFNEGKPSAYISTDIWVNFPEVWAQPIYLFVADLAAPDLEAHVLPLPFLMSVSPASAFWSPYFRVFYVQVPADTPPDRFQTVRAVLNAELPMRESGTRLVTLLPDPAMGPEDPSHFLLPPLRGPGMIGLPRQRAVYVDGLVGPHVGLDFGADRFELDDNQAVASQPLFFFFGHDATGAPVQLAPVPRVAGTGPLFANRAPIAPGNRPRYGALWRLYAAVLPSTARIFVPQARLAEWQARNWAGGPTLEIARIPGALDPGGDMPALDPFAFRVLLDETCLTTAVKADDLAACPWLDSQAALERYLPGGLTPSEILVTCPFVAHAGAPVPVPAP